jgi:hypothetical protein
MISGNCPIQCTFTTIKITKISNEKYCRFQTWLKLVFLFEKLAYSTKGRGGAGVITPYMKSMFSILFFLYTSYTVTCTIRTTFLIKPKLGEQIVTNGHN